MTRYLLAVGAAAGLSVCSAPAFAQCSSGGIWNETFESYTPGNLVDQSCWEAWDEAAAAGGSLVTTDVAFSGSNSITVAGADDIVTQFQNYNTGAWSLTARCYVPSDFVGESYYLLLNEYNHGGPYNWSMQIVFSSALGTIRDSDNPPGSVQLPIVYDEWVEIKVIIDFDGDTQTAFYDGVPFASKSWTEGASGGGQANFGCIDLFANGASVVYYDNFLLRTAPTAGACCFLDGSCTSEANSGDCETAGGTWRGISTLCAATDCPIYGDDGWEIEAPVVWLGDTCVNPEGGEPFLCGGPSDFTKDAQFVVDVPWTSDWTFSICGAPFDSTLALGTTPCAQDVAFDDDGCDAGLASEFTVTNLLAGTYYLTVSSFSEDECGSFTLSITGSCAAVPDPGGTPENEPVCEAEYTDITNGGCNSPGEEFLDIVCGTTINGEAGHYESTVLDCPTDIDGDEETGFQDLLQLLAAWGTDGEGADIADPTDLVDFQDLLGLLASWGECDPNMTVVLISRDTDWYRFTVAEPSIVTYTGFAEFPLQMLLIDGNMTCDDTPILDAATPGPCVVGEINWPVEAGTYYLWAGPSALGPEPEDAIDCGSRYTITLECTPNP